MGADDADIGPRPFGRIVVQADQQVEDEQHTHHTGQPHRDAQHQRHGESGLQQEDQRLNQSDMIQEHLHDRRMCLERAVFYGILQPDT